MEKKTQPELLLETWCVFAPYLLGALDLAHVAHAAIFRRRNWGATSFCQPLLGLRAFVWCGRVSGASVWWRAFCAIVFGVGSWAVNQYYTIAKTNQFPKQ